MPAISGRCVCGAVTYSATAEPIFSGVCHCKTCQRATGSAFGAVVAVPAPSLTVKGDVTQYDGIGDSGQATHRSFCPVCGSNIAMMADIMSGVVMLPIGTLDDTSWVKPTVQIYCQAEQGWLDLGGDMQRFEGMPGPG
ncbi:MAG TPA: GFA family protein [Rhodopila sp.]|nr:GFA family protein [Rhodopila sp.]